MITIQVLDSISSSSHKNGIGKNVLFFAKKVTSDLKLPGLKILPLIFFPFSHLLTNINHNSNRKLATEEQLPPILENRYLVTKLESPTTIVTPNLLAYLYW